MQNAKRTQGMRDLITRQARLLGVPVDVALAFAYLESRFDPTREGDQGWPFSHGAAYRSVVLDNPHFERNPWRADASRWHSYGLFQLLAPYHTEPLEDPRGLLNPQLNALRGVTAIKALLDRFGTVEAARLAYVGCGPDGTHCPPDKVAAVLGRLARARAQFQGAA